MNRIGLVALLLIVSVVAGCGSQATPAPESTLAPEAIESPLAQPTATTGAFESPVGLPNPASQFCEEQGYTLEIREGAEGQIGVCVFPDGTECEEWAFYRGECGPGTPKP